jgi:hypothetical protein
MEITRRDFIKDSLILGGSLLLSPVSLNAREEKEQVWHPAYEKKRNRSGIQPMRNWKMRVNWLRGSSMPTPSSRIVSYVHGVVE